MNEKEMSFQGQTFLEKEAARFPWFRKGAPRVSSPTNLTGTFVRDSGANTVNPEKVKFLNDAEKAQKVSDAEKRLGTSSMVADAGLWGIKKIPGFREPIEKTVAAANRGLTKADTYVGGLLAGKNPASFRGRLFSKKTPESVGVVQNPDTTFSELSKMDRRTSVYAPVEKTVKFTTPFLATAYVADKMYSDDEKDLGGNLNQATYENEMQKSSSLFDQSLSEQMDKVASMQKIAELETLVEKYADDLESAQLEKKAALDTLEKVTKEKAQIEKRASSAERNLLQKQAEHEELRLRTIAQQRSKVAVNLAEDMLEQKLIKQAEYKGTVDKLMECDEDTIKMYESLVKEARTSSDCLETLSYFGEYKENDKQAATPDLAKSGLSKRGQSMGEAARDLNK